MSQIRIYINDEEKNVPKGLTLLQLLQEYGLATRPGIAIVLNGEVIPKAEWGSHTLKEGDKIQIITAFQGG